MQHILIFHCTSFSFQYGDAATRGTQGRVDIEPKTLVSLVTELWTRATDAPNVHAQEHCFNLDPNQVKNAQIIQVLQARTRHHII